MKRFLFVIDLISIAFVIDLISTRLYLIFIILYTSELLVSKIIINTHKHELEGRLNNWLTFSVSDAITRREYERPE